jgi:hypothetical protein
MEENKVSQKNIYEIKEEILKQAQNRIYSTDKISSREVADEIIRKVSKIYDI